MSDSWTVAQAAVIIEKPAEQLHKAIERAEIRPALAQRGGRRTYVFEMRDLVFFRALDDLKAGLTNHKQNELYKALKNMPSDAPISSVAIGSLTFDFKPYVRFVKLKIEEAERSYRLIDRNGDEPVFRGTDINAYRIAALHDGMTVEEILRDYPSLDKQQVLAAKAYANNYPKAGRPYPKVTAKQAMRETRADAGQFLPKRG